MTALAEPLSPPARALPPRLGDLRGLLPGILGVAVVLGLPLLIHPLALNSYQYGVLAGLTVYAVPQVLAAAFPVSVLSGQVGTLVKLVRVLMLGPVVLFFALTHRNSAHADGDT